MTHPDGKEDHAPMLDVLLVDDEPAALRSLRSLISWESHGCRIAGEAANGEAALALFETESYDLVITDIRMPRLDGLELVARLREQSDVAVIMLSGYGEFEYARRGLQLGVRDYLLKPVGAEELVGKLREVQAELEEAARAEKLWYRGLPLMREQLARRLARGLLSDDAPLRELGVWTGGESGRYCVMIAELADGGAGDAGADRHLLRFAARNVIEELCAGRGLLFEESTHRLGIVYAAESDGAGRPPLEAARQFREAALRYAKAELAIAVGPTVEGYRSVAASYEAARELLDGKHLLPAAEPVWQAGEAKAHADSRRMLVEEVQQFVRERYRENIGLKQLASELYVNPNHLGQTFRTCTGLTFKEYLLQVRLEAAKSLLLHTDKKVYEIAQEVGFRELDWFYKKFKQHTGKSANEFRAEP